MRSMNSAGCVALLAVAVCMLWMMDNQVTEVAGCTRKERAHSNDPFGVSLRSHRPPLIPSKHRSRASSRARASALRRYAKPLNEYTNPCPNAHCELMQPPNLQDPNKNEEHYIWDMIEFAGIDAPWYFGVHSYEGVNICYPTTVKDIARRWIFIMELCMRNGTDVYRQFDMELDDKCEWKPVYYGPPEPISYPPAPRCNCAVATRPDPDKTEDDP